MDLEEHNRKIRRLNREFYWTRRAILVLQIVTIVVNIKSNQTTWPLFVSMAAIIVAGDIKIKET